MLVLVTGGSASGKSEYAEDLLCRLCNGKKLYIAAMQPYGPGDTEFSARVMRHRTQRAGKGFFTVERYTDLAGLQGEPCGGALVECLSNLCANEFFGVGDAAEHTKKAPVAKGPWSPERVRWQKAYNAVWNGVEHVRTLAQSVVVVTNEVFSDGCRYDEETLAYLRLLGALNTALAARADGVVEVVCGITAVRKNKGGWPL